MSPVGRRADFILGGKPFMLARGQFKGRAWTRTGRSDAPGVRSAADARFGALPDELDHPEVWDDWSGGAGHAYRRPGEPTYHWSENFDARFPRQLVHAQTLIPASAFFSGRGWIPPLYGFHNMMDLPFTATTPSGPYPEPAVLFTGQNQAWQGTPTGTIRADGNPTVSCWVVAVGPMGMSEMLGRGAIFGSAVYFPSLYPDLDGSSAMFKLQGNGSISQASASGRVLADGLCCEGNSLWKYSGSRLQSVAAGADPMLAPNWSATLNIGSGVHAISDMVAYGDQLMVGTPEGLFAGDQSGTFVNVLTELASQVHPDNCRDLSVFQGEVIVPHISGLYAYHQEYGAGIVEQIGPAGLSNKSRVRGWPRAARGFGAWLYAGYHTGSISYLLAGQQRSQGWVWHHMNRLQDGAKVGRIHFDGITTTSGYSPTRWVPTRLWVLGDPHIHATGNDIAYYAQIPMMNDNPLLADPTFSPNYVGSARMDFGAVDWGAPGTPKLFRSLEVQANNLASGAQWCDWWYRVDYGGPDVGTWHYLGIIAKSPKDVLYFPSGEGSFITGQSIVLSMDSYTASPGVTPVYRSVILRGALQPRSVDEISAVVRIADGLRDRQGGQMRSGATMLDELRSLGDPDRLGSQAHQLIDLSGATCWVKVAGRVQEQEVYQQGEDEPELAATVQMAVLKFSGA